MATRPLHEDASRGQDRHALILLFCTFSVCYAYFYQGPGFNQNSQFDTVRALIEHGTTDITAYAENTGDVGVFAGKVYSNKPPGLALFGAPVYYATYHLERSLGLDPGNAGSLRFNRYLLTFCTSGLPGVLLILLLFRHFRRKGATQWEGMWLAAAFGTGSLALPYAGVMMNHLFNACLLFAAWHLLTRTPLSGSGALLAGLFSGMAIVTESLAAPAALLFFLYVVVRRMKVSPLFLLGATLLTGGLFAYNYVSFGSPFVNNSMIQSDVFKTEGLLFGVLDWPHPIRLFWLTFHPFRGLFFCCPVLLLPLLSIRWPALVRGAALETVVPLTIVAYHFLFNMSFNGWTGGWGAGPRYLIPALPFLFSFALPGFRRFRIVSGVLAAVSSAFMLSVSAVGIMMRAPNGGPPLPFSPVLDCLRQLAKGHVSMHGGRNLGELLGLRGVASLIPLMLVLLASALLARRLNTDWR